MAITLQNVSFSYGEKTIFHNVSYTFPESGVLCLSAPSGYGKTTLFRLLMGLEQPQSGQILGHTALTVATVFQEDRLLPWLTAAENVAIGNRDKGAVEAALRDVQLWDERDAYPPSLSGGMQRRVAIARALAADADVLLLDEPFTGLDRPLWSSLAQLIKERYAGKLILLITHQEEEAVAFGAKTVLLSDWNPS